MYCDGGVVYCDGSVWCTAMGSVVYCNGSVWCTAMGSVMYCDVTFLSVDARITPY